jgi:NAD(P)-dependent dehydrogenase (short-subunit alcohol dehydrogenase family)
MVERPDLIRRTLDAVGERLRAGDFVPLPVRVFPAAQIAEAFRCMAQARHVGKLVVDMEARDGLTLRPRLSDRTAIRADRTYLVTGGFGGFGLEVARWLARQGARHLALAGRQGAATPRATEGVEELRRDGVAVLPLAADIADSAQVTQALTDIARTLPPLAGVFHAAAVLDDALLVNLDAGRLRRVMAPKARGAWLLHQQTRTQPLDYFVLFSSATAWIGNPGQGNYVAANAFLDALAMRRRAEGLAATSISWGALADVGMLAGNAPAVEHLSRMGVRSMPVSAATDALKRILDWDVTCIGVMDVDWDRWQQVAPSARRCPRFSHVMEAADGSAGSGGRRDIRTALRALPPEERLETLAAGIAEVLAESLRIPIAKVDRLQPLTEMGIDSLMGTELQTAIGLKLGLELSLLELLRGDNINGVALHMLKKMNVWREPAAS